ncbi:SIR2 family protein [uncultured Alloprevotella sp.]|uniref:SIR2 family protein n=1 Tax=uncultured Alloprevotella sp. TaxID=1283315 RepID=UPI002633C659|nr:SIR2 family protein [uncultured Alloprevotella sp.]
MGNIPRGLKKAIENDELVLFIGAGLSCELKNTEGTTLGGWKEMVSSMLSYLNKEDYITDEEQKSYEKLEPIDALKKLEEKDEPIGKEEVGDFIKCYFELEKGNDLSLQKALFSLSTKIITTNYDIALEEAAPELKSKKAYKTKGFELEKIRNNPTFLFKLHGCIEDLKSLILFPSDYDDLYNSKSQDAEQVLKALDNLIYNKTFLFIGTGMGDPQITSFFEKIKSVKGKHSQKHYIITPKPLNKSLNFLTRIEINDYAEIPSVIKQLLLIKENAETKKSTEEKLRLKQIEELKEKNISLTKQLGQVQNEFARISFLLEREANNRFSTGLKHHQAEEYLEASEEYKAATELNPEYSEAYNNWGIALVKLAKTKSGSEAEELYKEAFEEYNLATTYKQDDHQVYYNWGVALMKLATIKSGNEAEELYEEAFEKYKLATTYKQDDHNTYDAWGVALVELAKTKSGSEAKKLLNEAIKKFQQAVEYGGDAYNLACLYAIRNQKVEALKYLDIALSRKEITIDFVEQDEDWKELRNDPDFQDLLSRYKK